MAGFSLFHVPVRKYAYRVTPAHRAGYCKTVFLTVGVLPASQRKLIFDRPQANRVTFEHYIFCYLENFPKAAQVEREIARAALNDYIRVRTEARHFHLNDLENSICQTHNAASMIGSVKDSYGEEVALKAIMLAAQVLLGDEDPKYGNIYPWESFAWTKIEILNNNRNFESDGMAHMLELTDLRITTNESYQRAKAPPTTFAVVRVSKDAHS